MTYAALVAILGEKAFAKPMKKRLGDHPTDTPKMPVPKFEQHSRFRGESKQARRGGQRGR